MASREKGFKSSVVYRCRRCKPHCIRGVAYNGVIPFLIIKKKKNRLKALCSKGFKATTLPTTLPTTLLQRHQKSDPQTDRQEGQEKLN